MFIPPSPMDHLIVQAGEAADYEVEETALRPNGTPYIITSEPAAWVFDREMGLWTQIASSWWTASPLNEHEGRTRNGRSGPSGPLAEIEQKVAAKSRSSPPEDKPKWWDESLSCGHYETRLRAARLLGSKEEYRHWLKEYAKFLGDENFRERAEDLLSELMGPVYQ